VDIGFLLPRSPISLVTSRDRAVLYTGNVPARS